MGLQEIAETYGCETHYSEFVELSEYEARFRSYAEDGFNVIIGHGSEFFDAAAAVAPDFPDVAFVITSTDQHQAPNLASVNTLPADMGALAGVAMAKATKSGTVGVIGGMSLVSIVAACNAATGAAIMTNPDINVLTNMTGDDEDKTKAKEVALAMIDKGADVIFYDADAAGLGALEACQEKGVLAIPAIAMNDTEVTLMGAINDIPHAMDAVVGKVVDGTFAGEYYPMGCADDCAYYITGSAWDANMDDEAAAAVEDVYQKLISGELNSYDIIDEYCPDDLRVS
jgi:basic membrane protein A